MIDITEFVKTNREQLLNALVAAGIPREEIAEVCSKAAPFGRWNRPVILLDKRTHQPLASYFLSYPKVGDDQKTVRFNINTFNTVLAHLNVNREETPSHGPEAPEPAGV